MPLREIPERQEASKYVPGYDWKLDRFGPPPGIPKSRKDEFDRMSDKEYLYAFLKLSQEEKESLMVSEAERRRTFAAQWPIETIVKAHDCAKEGLYFTGVADLVQCAFCGGTVKDWERGDVPSRRHKLTPKSQSCKIVQKQRSSNIQVDIGVPADLITDGSAWYLGYRGAYGTTTPSDLNINTLKATNINLASSTKRIRTYMRCPPTHPASVDEDKLCKAGFSYDEQKDILICFYCDGRLKMWRQGRDPWIEHAKWYPGCVFVQQVKGLKFIREVRSKMSSDDIAQSDSLVYNKGNVAFLQHDGPGDEIFEGNKYCLHLGYTTENIAKAYEANGGEEFDDSKVLTDIVRELTEGKNTLLVLQKSRLL